jgi:protein O-GlcNAc transferase
MSPSDTFQQLIEQGSRLHGQGQPENALVCFEKALALAPGDVQAASACATVLAELGQPQAAFEVLHGLRDRLLHDADGATNYAIAAETCGRTEDARQAYARALQLDPHHLRALNNTALMAAQSGDWDLAISRLALCQTLAIDVPAVWCNLADIQIAARRFAAAVATLDEAVRRFVSFPPIAVRRAIALAFDGQIESAQTALDALDADGQGLLVTLVAGANRSTERLNRKALGRRPDAYELFCQQAFDAMQICDWRDHDRLTAVLRELLARCARTGQGRDWRDAQLCGLMLPMHEDEMAQLRRVSIDTIGKQLGAAMPAFVAQRSRRRDDRIHVGLAVQSLRDPRVANGLRRQLALHDHKRFAVHLYSPTPQPDPAVTQGLAAQCASAIEIAHMSDDESVARIRLDELDIFVDMAFDTPWCRPEIPERRVAPVQIRQITWHRHHPPRPCEYNMSDRFVHPDGIDMAPYGAVVRLPVTCWLATNDDLPDGPPPTRTELGLPGDALVLCAQLPALMVDPQSFGLWMQMLQALPDAVFWLPPYQPQAQRNLAEAARSAGVNPSRLVFQPRSSRAQWLARLPVADLFVDSVRFNANQGLVDALRMGVPAVTCAGNSMAARLGGSIVQAAELPQGITCDPAAFVRQVVQLGQDRAMLHQWRQDLARRHATAPLFDAAARVREWESAWTVMAQRQQAGLPPTAFDVARAPAQATPASAPPVA